MATVHWLFLWGRLGPPTVASPILPFPYRCGCLAVCRVSIKLSIDPGLFSQVRLLHVCIYSTMPRVVSQQRQATIYIADPGQQFPRGDEVVYTTKR